MFNTSILILYPFNLNPLISINPEVFTLSYSMKKLNKVKIILEEEDEKFAILFLEN